jgi:hypothetical protein
MNIVSIVLFLAASFIVSLLTLMPFAALAVDVLEAQTSAICRLFGKLFNYMGDNFAQCVDRVIRALIPLAILFLVAGYCLHSIDLVINFL